MTSTAAELIKERPDLVDETDRRHHSEMLGNVVQDLFAVPQQEERDDDLESDEPFDWTSENPNVLVHTQDSLALYLNPANQIVIRAEGSLWSTDDVCIVISYENVPAIIRRLKELLAEIEPPSTGASRTRRWRAKQASLGDEAVTSQRGGR